MADRRGVWGEESVLYPEIVRAGDLAGALRAEFARDGLRYGVACKENSAVSHCVAVVGEAERRSEVRLVLRVRGFRVKLRAGRAAMGYGQAPDLAAAAGAVHLWQSGARVSQVAAAWPFLGSVELALAYERGDALEIQWRVFYEDPGRLPQLVRVRPFVALAFHEPRLRALMPFTSHFNLGLSTTSQWPYRSDAPRIEPKADGLYLVKAADKRELGTADAPGSLALVLAELSS